MYQNLLGNIFSSIVQGQLKKVNFIKLKNVFIKENSFYFNVLKLLKNEGFIKRFYISDNVLYVYLKYSNNVPIIKSIVQISRPSRRVYLNKHLLVEELNNKPNCTLFLSTNKGIMSGMEALKNGYGGEYLCYIY